MNAKQLQANLESIAEHAAADALLSMASEMATSSREHWRPPTDCHNLHGEEWADILRAKAKNHRAKAARLILLSQGSSRV